jgi:ABC-type multidrug transport system fused ATPase/permease subunit
VISLPDTRLPAPDLRSAGRFLWWQAALQGRTLAGGTAASVLWMLCAAAGPALVGRTVDAGIAGRDGTALALGTAALLLLGAVQAAATTIRHRITVASWLLGTLRTQQLVGHQVAGHGTAVARATTTGEVISCVSADALQLGGLYEAVGTACAAVVTYAAVAVTLLRIDTGLGLFVLFGAPVLAASLLGLVRPLNRRLAARREADGRLTALGADTVAGLRVLRGIGGEDRHLARYAERSDEVRRTGLRIAGPQAGLSAAHVLLPGVFVVALTWLGARAALTGRITPGELVTLYGYAAFLTLPLVTVTDTLSRVVRARVAAARVVRLLRLRDGAHGVPVPVPGLAARPGVLTAVVAGEPADAARAAGGLAGGRALFCEAEPRLFSGTLRAAVDPDGGHTDAEVLSAIRTADAAEVLHQLPGGLDGHVTERGRSLSGGQRQRVALARAVLAAPEVLVLVEPTSAVDAHTEARIADRLRAARAGRTTVVTTSSPLLLDRADHVVLLDGGRVAAEGTHRDLLRTHTGYRALVTRDGPA